MTKEQALYQFWSSFGLPAYDEGSVPDSAVLPYITYSSAIGRIDGILSLTASVWDRSYSWQFVSSKTEQISKQLEQFYITDVDDGKMWITAGSPFAYRVTDPDDAIRRMTMNVNVEFLSAY